jgi:hypothetical protein
MRSIAQAQLIDADCTPRGPDASRNGSALVSLLTFFNVFSLTLNLGMLRSKVGVWKVSRAHGARD